jgi:putative ABC transport system permease protein
LLKLRTLKILRDLSTNKNRTLLVIITIGIGVFAVGSVSRAWVILSNNLSRNYLAVSPSSATITTLRPFDESFVNTFRRMPEVGEAEGRNDYTLRVKGADGRWYLLRLITRTDYDQLTLDKIRVENGVLPPPTDGMLLERSSLDLLGLDTGDTAVVRLADGKMDKIHIAGVVHDVTQTPTDFTYTIYGYITQKTLYRLNKTSDYNKLDIIVADQPLDKRHIQDVVEAVVDKMEANGMVVTDKEIPNPGVHQLNDIIQSVLQLLIILTILAVLLGTFLVINIISALLAQQVQQIGAMKAVGGRSQGIAMMYLTAMLLLGTMALLIFVPMGILMSRSSAVFVAGFINFDITDYSIPPQIYALEFATALLLPCVAALYPILSGARITVREAIQQSGIQAVQFGANGFEAFLNKMRGLPPIVLYAFRNIFRRKVRLALATLTLSIAGAVFISVFSVRASLLVTIDEISTYWQEDVILGFYQFPRLDNLEHLAADVPGISEIEGRLIYNGFRVRPDDRESTQQINLFGINPQSTFIKPVLLAGRWLRPEDDRNVVVNIDLLELEPDVAVGDDITFRTGDIETTWQVVGIVTSQVVGGGELLKAPIAYANYQSLSEAVAQRGRVNRLLIAIDPALATEEGTLNALEDVLQKANTRVVFSLLNSEVRSSLASSFAIIINLVQLMSLLFAIVGGLGLMSMMSLNVLERTQEIGIIRVIGGVGRHIQQIVIIESLVVGLLSWIIGSLLAYPVSNWMCIKLGITMLNVPLTHIFPWQGLVIWLVFILVLAVLASIIPARNAAQLIIRETLTYE